MSLNIQQLNAAYGGNNVLHDITLPDIPAGSVTVLLGPNAAGKSTLFKALSGSIKSHAANITLHGDDWLNSSHEQRMQRLSYLPQVYHNDIALSVFESVLLGCKSAHGGWHVSNENIKTVDSLLNQFGISEIAHQSFNHISGGQQQIAAICQVLARPSGFLLLDEPTSALDLRLQLTTLEQIKAEAQRRNAVCIISLHDLNLAAAFADQLIVMKAGRIQAYGDTKIVIESDVLEEVYQVNLNKMKQSDGRYLLSANISP